jgi:hypothetical protein
MYAGFDAGKADMAHTIAEYTPRGMPPGAAIILSADKSVPVGDFEKVRPYYQGAQAAAAGRYLTGAYAEQALIAYLKSKGTIQIGWRSMSTSFPGGSSIEHCDIVQTGPGTCGGVEIDKNYATVPFFGQWMPGRLAGKTVQIPTPKPPPVQDSAPLRMDTDMQQIEPTSIHPGEYAFGLGSLGPLGSITFSCDGYGQSAKLRAVVWNTNGPQVFDNLIVGGSAASAHKATVQFAIPAATFLVTVHRLDDGTFPIGVAVP